MYRHKKTLKLMKKVKIKIERINESKKRKKKVCVVRSKFVLFGLVVKQLILLMKGTRSVCVWIKEEDALDHISWFCVTGFGIREWNIYWKIQWDLTWPIDFLQLNYFSLSLFLSLSSALLIMITLNTSSYSFPQTFLLIFRMRVKPLCLVSFSWWYGYKVKN